MQVKEEDSGVRRANQWTEFSSVVGDKSDADAKFNFSLKRSRTTSTHVYAVTMCKIGEINCAHAMWDQQL